MGVTRDIIGVVVIAFALGMLRGTVACGGGGGESKCGKFCDSVRQRLIQDFGVQPGQIDCSNQQWDTDDCQPCIDILENDFGVQSTGLQYCESL